MNRKILTGCVTGLVLLIASTIAIADESTTLKEIMQKLRNNLVEISDGLLTDDFEQIQRGATGIAEHPQIPAAQIQLVAAELGPEMPTFKQIDTLVHNLALEIGVAAKTSDHRAAMSGYQRMIEGCLTCHSTFKDRVTAVLAEPPGQ
jgi:hypothetical protein